MEAALWKHPQAARIHCLEIAHAKLPEMFEAARRCLVNTHQKTKGVPWNLRVISAKPQRSACESRLAVVCFCHHVVHLLVIREQELVVLVVKVTHAMGDVSLHLSKHRAHDVLCLRMFLSELHQI